MNELTQKKLELYELREQYRSTKNPKLKEKIQLAQVEYRRIYLKYKAREYYKKDPQKMIQAVLKSRKKSNLRKH